MCVRHSLNNKSMCLRNQQMYEIGFYHINDTVRSDIDGRIKGELLVLCKVCAQFLRYERQIPSDNDIQRYNVLRSGYFNKQ